MAKFTITFEADTERSKEILFILFDSLSEFAFSRTPARTYVEKRYPNGYLGDHEKDEEKIEQVAKRASLAEQIRTTISISKEDSCAS